MGAATKSTAVLREWFQQQAIRKAAFSTETLRIYQAALSKTGVLSAALNYYRQWLNPQMWLPRLSQSLVDVPTLVLWGQDDSVLNPALAKAQAGFVSSGLNLQLIPECGHWIQQEVPELVNLELLAFLRQ